MATLDNFFAKLSRPPVSAHNVSEDAASGATCFEPKIISVEGRFHDHCDNEEKRPSKRIRHGGSASDRLKTRKKQKVGGDLKERNENENFKQDETINVDGELQTVDDETSEDCAETVNRHSLNEISYEDFLAANEASSKENKQTPIKKENQDDIVTQAEICDIVAHVNDGQTSNPDGTEKLANVSSNEGKDDLSSGVPPSSVASKDIRSFFGKTTANAASQNRPKSCATKMKVKAEVHVEPSVHATVTNNKPSADANRHMDLARWQRANIVITNADLDIEIIDVCNTSFDAKTAEENTEVVLVDEPMTIDEKMILPRPLAVSGPVVANLQQTSSAKLPEMPALETGSYTSSESVNVVDLTKCGRKTRQKNSTNIISKKCDENKLPAHSIDLSIDESEGSNCHIQKEIAIAENSCAKTVITEDLDCKLEVKAAVDSSCDQTAKKNLQRCSEDSSCNHTPSTNADLSKDAAYLSQLTSSSEKLAEIFTPRSRRHAEAKLATTSSGDEKQSDADNSIPARRQSSRLSAKAAADAIAKAAADAVAHTLEDPVKPRKVKKSSDNSDSDVEVVLLEKQSEKVNNSGKNMQSTGKGMKLAPIFMKQSTVKANLPPVLTAEELEAQRVRREFLISGIPEELKRQQEASQSLVLCPTPAPWPTDSHIMQRQSADSYVLDPWNLPEARLTLRDCPQYQFPEITSCNNLLLGDLMSAQNENVCCEFGVHEVIPEDVKTLLLAEIQSTNYQFPVSRFYSQLKGKQTQLEEFAKTETDDCDSLLWTDKYMPTCASEVVGNWSASKRLRDWLMQWKERIARFAEKSSTQKSSTHHQKTACVNTSVCSPDDSDFDYSIESYDSDVNSGESYLCNAIVLHGPHGVGKTAMVYALASELGFKIFEVNSSGQRDGKHVLTQLQEATQSHQVSRTTLSAASSDSERSSLTASADAASKETASKAKKVKSQADEGQTCKKGKSHGDNKPFASIFAKANTSSGTKKNQTKAEPKRADAKVKNDKTESVCSTRKSEETSNARNSASASDKKKSTSKKEIIVEAKKNDAKQADTDEKISSSSDRIQTSLILFEEVDVVLNEDRGFWHAIETFMSITKRPILLTASDPNFLTRFNGRVESIKLHMPQWINTASYLQTICLVENVRTSHADMLSLASMTQGDIRRALLQLQCWTLTGAAGQRRHAAPVYVHAEDGKSAETKATTVEKTQTKPAAVPQAERNSNCHTPVVVVPDSDDEFTQVRNKKRRLQRFPSTDDDSQSSGLGLKGDDPFVGVDECSQESYSQAPCEFEASVSVPRTVALSADLAPAVHRMCVESAGTGAASRMLTCGGEAICRPQWIGDCWWSQISVFDSALQDVSFEPCADDTRSALSKAPSVKSMYGLYDVYSSIDCCYSGRHCSLPATDWHGLLPGNTDSLSNDDFLNQMVKRRSEIDEIRTVLNELTCKATNKWMTVERLSDKSPCVEDRTIRLRQEVIQHEKLSREAQSAVEYVQLRHPGLQRRALVMDYLPSLRTVAKSENVRQAVNSKRRFYHYLRSTFPDLRSSVLDHLCHAFS